MTTTITEDDRRTLRAAQRAWYHAGVRRTDRRRLQSDLRSEIDAARAAGDPIAILGTDPAGAAKEWAEAEGLTGARTRVALLAPPMIVGGALASGGVLVPVLQAFGNGGSWFLGGASVPVILALYLGTGLVAYVSMLAVALALLSLVDDGQRSRSIRVLSGLLPLGAAIACASGVAAAAVLHDEVRPRTFILVGLVVLIVMMTTIAAARLVATRVRATWRPTGHLR